MMMLPLRGTLLVLLALLVGAGCRGRDRTGHHGGGAASAASTPAFKASERWDLRAVELSAPGRLSRKLVYHPMRDGEPRLTGGRRIPTEAAQVFVHEGRPRAIGVSGRYIAVVYGHSGVLFHRGSGEPVRRLTLAQGWPESRPPEFDRVVQVSPGSLAGDCAYAGIRRCGDPGPLTVDGETWTVEQPRSVLAHLRFPTDPPRPFTTWHAILEQLERRSALRVGRRRYTRADGMPGNIVPDLVRFGGAVWAAFLDIYQPRRGAWGPGGLARFDRTTRRWQRVQIQGRAVRWVSLLQVVGDELWVGYREGRGVAGERVALGRRYWLGQYRPRARQIVLARYKDGVWRRFQRPPLRGTAPAPPPLLESRAEEDDRIDEPGVVPIRRRQPSPSGAPTEQAVRLVRQGRLVFLLSHAGRRKTPRGLEYLGRISVLDTSTGEWQYFENREDLGARQLYGITAAGGEVLLASSRGVHRWSEGRWRWLDPQSPLLNGEVSAAVPVGDELWVGFANDYWSSGRQGIQCYNERSGKWRRITPATLGIRCPVHRIVPLSADDVWVLFKQRWWMLDVGGQVALSPPYRMLDCQRGPRSLRRMRHGAWRTPHTLLGVLGGAPVREMVAVGAHLFLLDDRGVHRGPGKWHTVARVSGMAAGIEPTPDGRRLRILSGQQVERILDPVSGVIHRVRDSAERETAGPRWVYYPHGRSLAPRHWLDQRRPLLINQDGDWAVGPLGRTLVETVYAFWFVAPGQLIRLDKAELGAGLNGE